MKMLNSILISSSIEHFPSALRKHYSSASLDPPRDPSLLCSIIDQIWADTVSTAGTLAAKRNVVFHIKYTANVDTTP